MAKFIAANNEKGVEQHEKRTSGEFRLPIAHVLIGAEADLLDFSIVSLHLSAAVRCVNTDFGRTEKFIGREASSARFERRRPTRGRSSRVIGQLKWIDQVDRFPAFAIAVLQHVLRKIELSLAIFERESVDEETKKKQRTIEEHARRIGRLPGHFTSPALQRRVTRSGPMQQQTESQK